eukprot:68604_1
MAIGDINLNEIGMNEEIKGIGEKYVVVKKYLNFHGINTNLVNLGRDMKLKYHFAVQDENKDENSNNNDDQKERKKERPKYIPKNKTYWYNTIRETYDEWEAKNTIPDDVDFNHFNINIFRKPRDIKYTPSYLDSNHKVDALIHDISMTYLNQCCYNQKK